MMWQTLQGMVLLTTRNLKVFLWGAFVFFFFFSLFFGFGVVWILSLHDTYLCM
jgi:hypothetical protein